MEWICTRFGFWMAVWEEDGAVSGFGAHGCWAPASVSMKVGRVLVGCQGNVMPRRIFRIDNGGSLGIHCPICASLSCYLL